MTPQQLKVKQMLEREQAVIDGLKAKGFMLPEEVKGNMTPQEFFYIKGISTDTTIGIEGDYLLTDLLTEYHELQSVKDRERIAELEKHYSDAVQIGKDLKSMNEELTAEVENLRKEFVFAKLELSEAKKEVERLRGLDTKIHLSLIRENEELEAEVERLRGLVEEAFEDGFNGGFFEDDRHDRWKDFKSNNNLLTP